MDLFPQQKKRTLVRTNKDLFSKDLGVRTSALTIFSMTAPRVSSRLHFETPSNQVLRCSLACLSVISKLLYVFSAAKFCLTETRKKNGLVMENSLCGTEFGETHNDVEFGVDVDEPAE